MTGRTNVSMQGIGGGDLTKLHVADLDFSNNSNGGFGWNQASAIYDVFAPLSARDNADGTLDILSAHQDPSGFRHPFLSVHCNGDETFLMYVKRMKVNTYIDWNRSDVATISSPFSINLTFLQAHKVIVINPTYNIDNYEVKISFGARGLYDAGLYGVSLMKCKTRKLFDALGLFKREAV